MIRRKFLQLLGVAPLLPKEIDLEELDKQWLQDLDNSSLIDRSVVVTAGSGIIPPTPAATSCSGILYTACSG